MIIFKEKILSFVLWLFRKWIEELTEDTFDEYEKRVIAWGEEEGLFEDPDVRHQCLKTLSGAGILASAVSTSDDVQFNNSVGFILFRLILLCKMKGTTLTGCLAGTCSAIAPDKNGNG